MNLQPQPEPVQLATVPAQVLRDQQWDLAVLFMQALTRTLTAVEVQDQIHKLSTVLGNATYSWKE